MGHKKTHTGFITQTGVILILFLSLYSRLFSGESDGIKIAGIDPFLKNEFLVFSANMENLFSKKNISTIQSGLPSLIQIEIKLYDAEDENIFETTLVRSISYSVWDEYYEITSKDSTFITEDLPTLIERGSRLTEEILVKKENLTSTSQYYLKIQVQISSISPEQNRKVSAWISNPNQSEEYLLTEKKTSTFQLNITHLIDSVMGRTKATRNSSVWHKSGLFRINKNGELIK